MAESVYANLEFPEPPSDRPYVLLNMVATIDGKTTSGDRDEPVQDLGSKVDHATMHALEGMADGLIIGAGTLRATPRINVPAHVARFCVTRSGQIDFDHNFFTDAPTRSWAVAPEGVTLPGSVIRAGTNSVDLDDALRQIRRFGIKRLLCEGGSELNAELLRADVVDELFMTIAPKVRLGRNIPTIAGGEALDREAMLQFELVSSIAVESEVFLRYRRHR